MAFGQLAQFGKEAVQGRDHAHIGSDWLDDYSGNFVSMAFKQALDRLQIVIRSIERELGQGIRHAGRGRDA